MNHVAARCLVAWSFLGTRVPGSRWQAEIRKKLPTVDFVTVLRSRALRSGPQGSGPQGAVSGAPDQRSETDR